MGWLALGLLILLAAFVVFMISFPVIAHVVWRSRMPSPVIVIQNWRNGQAWDARPEAMRLIAERERRSSRVR